jgi:RNA polymerase sigma factor (sigma-70 family)
MKIMLAADLETATDASLIALSLAGDRDAFGRIVTRYQSSICALAFSACGDVARSEDIAQDIFITAWRELGGLQEPAKFKAWLYGIARNLIHNAFRRSARNPLADAQLLDDATEPASPADEPGEQAISKDEETILWRVLSGLPEVYREPMILFYRQDESIPRVAEVLAISEEAVRQRLSRGRTLLSARVSKFIQNGLRRSGPADTFAGAVVVSLPMVATATSAKGAVLGVAATRGAAGPATGVVGLLKIAGWIAGIMALPSALGAFFGHKLSQDAAGLPRRRKSAGRFWRVFGAGLAVFVFLPLLLTFTVTGSFQGAARAKFLSAMTSWLGLGYLVVLAALVWWAWQRRRRQDDPPASPAQNDLPPQQSQAIRVGQAGGRSRRFVLFMTLAAAGLLVFCFTDTNYNVGSLSPAAFQSLINENAPSELRVSIMEGHDRSIWGDSPEISRSFWIEVRKNGKVAKYSAGLDEAARALLAQKGIPCPTYVQGRDFEVLGAPGRFLPLLAAFVLAVGVVFLLKQRRSARA